MTHDGRRKTEGEVAANSVLTEHSLRAERVAVPSVFRLPSRLREPLSFEVQCWIAWTGLFAFGLRGILVYREIGAYPPLELGAVVLAICWAIDLVRTRVQLNRARHD